MLQGRRLAVMLNSAMGVVARDAGDGVFVDLDTIPEIPSRSERGYDTFSRPALKRFETSSRRKPWARRTSFFARRRVNPAGACSRSSRNPRSFRSTYPSGSRRSRNPRTCPGRFVPGRGGAAPVPVFAAPSRVLEAAAPKLTREEELFAISLSDLARGTLGADAAGNSRGGRAPGTGGDGVADARRARVGSSPRAR